MKNEKNLENNFDNVLDGYNADLKKISRSYQDDIVDGIYKIHVLEPIESLDNQFCRYYKAYNIENNAEYFAILFLNNLPPPIDLLSKLKTSNIRGLNKVVAYSIVRLSSLNRSHFVVIVEKYDINNNLTNYISANGPLVLSQIEEKLIPSVSQVLDKCQRFNVSCGNIHPNNIIIDSKGDFMLREFFNSYASFYQSDPYLAPEILECNEYGRLTRGVAVDIYALGITVFYAFTATQPWEIYSTMREFNERRLENTTFRLLCSNARLPEHLKKFLLWTLYDNVNFRWGVSNIFDWLDNKLYSGMKEEVYKYPFAFCGANYTNLKSIAYVFCNNWQQALQSVKDAKLLKWIQKCNFDNSLVENIRKILGDNKNQKVIYSDFEDLNHKLIKLLLAIDPQGGIRLPNMVISAPSINQVLHYFLTTNKSASVNVLLHILHEKYWNVGNNINFASMLDSSANKSLQDFIKIFSNQHPAFGVERLLYSLNPQSYCLSTLVENECVMSLSDLLVVLDKIASLENNMFTIDRHIIAFIAAKIGMMQDNEIKILTNFPNISQHPVVYGACILDIVQRYEPNVDIPNLCKALGSKLIELFEQNIHNQSFKKQITNSISDEAKKGKISNILSVFKDPTPFINDYNNYYNICKELEKMQSQIESLDQDLSISKHALILGQKLTVLASYILCFVVTVIVIV